eukprot:s831_g17.t1
MRPFADNVGLRGYPVHPPVSSSSNVILQLCRDKTASEVFKCVEHVSEDGLSNVRCGAEFNACLVFFLNSVKFLGSVNTCRWWMVDQGPMAAQHQPYICRNVSRQRQCFNRLNVYGLHGGTGAGSLYWSCPTTEHEISPREAIAFELSDDATSEELLALSITGITGMMQMHGTASSSWSGIKKLAAAEPRSARPPIF